MKDRPDIEALRDLPQEQLAKILCEAYAIQILARAQDAKKGGTSG